MGAVLTVIGAFGVVAGMIVVLGLLISFPMMLLWNGCLVPAVPAVHEVGWLQMWGLMILFGFLFKSTTTTKK